MTFLLSSYVCICNGKHFEDLNYSFFFSPSNQSVGFKVEEHEEGGGPTAYPVLPLKDYLSKIQDLWI